MAPPTNAMKMSVLKCTDAELARLKAAYKHQLQSTYVHGRPFYGQRSYKADPDGSLREAMWIAVANSEPAYNEMLSGARWGDDRPQDLAVRIQAVKDKICRDHADQPCRPENRHKYAVTSNDDQTDRLAFGASANVSSPARGQRRLRSSIPRLGSAASRASSRRDTSTAGTSRAASSGGPNTRRVRDDADNELEDRTSKRARKTARGHGQPGATGPRLPEDPVVRRLLRGDETVDHAEANFDLLDEAAAGRTRQASPFAGTVGRPETAGAKPILSGKFKQKMNEHLDEMKQSILTELERIIVEQVLPVKGSIERFRSDLKNEIVAELTAEKVPDL